MRRTITTLLATLALLATGVVAGLAAGGTGTVDPPPRIAFLANGIVPADALAAGGIAGQLGAPLFTTPADTLNGDASAGIVAYDPDLVIVLGGPVAITDDVVAALATATGLSLTTADAPTGGIVRVAGGDRFATARAVADLLAAYDPAYLPVDATALGAVDADTATSSDTAGFASEAGDADTLDGLDAAAFEPAGDFALADQACTAGRVVTGIAADGTPSCSEALDPSGELEFSTLNVTEGGRAAVTLERFSGGTSAHSASSSAFVSIAPDLPGQLFGQRFEVVGTEFCYSTNGAAEVRFIETSVETYGDSGTAVSQADEVDSTVRTDDDCVRLDFSTPQPLDEGAVAIGFLGIDAPDSPNAVDLGRTTWFLRPVGASPRTPNSSTGSNPMTDPNR